MARSGESIPEAERQDELIYMEAEQPHAGQMAALIRDRLDLLVNGRDERGSLGTLMTGPAGKIAAGVGRRVVGNSSPAPEQPRRPWARRTAKLGIALGMVAGVLTMCDASGETSVDWRNAYTTANVTKIVWDHHTEITPGTIGFFEDMRSTNIEWDMNSAHHEGPIPVPDLWPKKLDPHVNRQLIGAGQEILGVPIEAALTEYDYRGKIYFKVDMSKLDGKISMAGAGPQYNPFTMHDGKMNLGDPEGFRDQAAHAVAGVGSLLNGSMVQNMLNQADEATRHDMTLAWLKAMGTCNQQPDFLDEAKKQITQSLTEWEAMQPDSKEVGHVLFVNENVPFHIDTGQLASSAVGAKYQSKPIFATVKPNVLTCSDSQEGKAN